MDRRERQLGLVKTQEEMAKNKERDSLELSRVRILNDLEQSANPRYREILSASLEHLDQKLKLLD